MTTAAVNPETASDRHPVDVTLRVPVRDRGICSIVLSIPFYIREKLSKDPSAWYVIGCDLQKRAAEIFDAAVGLGLIGDVLDRQVQQFLTIAARERVYHEFMNVQDRLGNPAWHVPESLSPTKLVLV